MLEVKLCLWNVNIKIGFYFIFLVIMYILDDKYGYNKLC